MKSIKDYFAIHELVCPHVYNRFGEAAWEFLDKDLLDVLLFIREHLNRPIYINNYKWGGDKSQRGLRCNCDPLVKEKTYLEKPYLSAHIFGKGVDFHVQGMTAEEVRKWIADYQVYLPCSIRLETEISWIHLDVIDYGKSANKITYFKG